MINQELVFPLRLSVSTVWSEVFNNSIGAICYFFCPAYRWGLYFYAIYIRWEKAIKTWIGVYCLERRYINRIIMQNMVAKFYSYKLLICYIKLVKCRVQMSCSEGIISESWPKQAIEMFGSFITIKRNVSVVYVIFHCRYIVFFLRVKSRRGEGCRYFCGWWDELTNQRFSLFS